MRGAHSPDAGAGDRAGADHLCRRAAHPNRRRPRASTGQIRPGIGERDGVVFLVSSHELDIGDPVGIVDANHQSEFIPGDIRRY